ncbi:MAG: ABC transporter ATP-binding protein [Candidatus Hydrogenedentes bacterium]|nr:ABC transporter ATP-binding protein [Candidatus Hydrogenedentota bacterium]
MTPHAGSGDAPPVLALENIHFLRNGRPILRDISWTVRRGDHWAVLGANGSGKTTLLKIITGYEWASEGSVRVLDRQFGQTDVPRLRKLIGWVSSSLEHRLPGHDLGINVVMSGVDASLGVYRQFTDHERATAYRALVAVGGDGLAEKRYGVLSQGEQQRVLIARALVAQPSLLILDEPCAGLDPAARYHFLSDMARLASSPNPPTLILVTHHIEEIGPWINRVLVLKQGRLLAQGSPESCLREDILSDAFSIPCTIKKDSGFYQLQILNSKRL